MTAVHLSFPSRRAERVAQLTIALGAVLIAVVPVYYVIVLPACCALAGLVAPVGRRLVSAMAAWVPVSAAVLLGLAVTP